jgi:hypothetical protein
MSRIFRVGVVISPLVTPFRYKFWNTLCDDAIPSHHQSNNTTASDSSEAFASCKKKVCATKLDMLKKAFNAHNNHESGTHTNKDGFAGAANGRSITTERNMTKSKSEHEREDGCPVDTEQLGNAACEICAKDFQDSVIAKPPRYLIFYLSRLVVQS